MFVSLGLLHCSLTCLPALAVWRCTLANHGVQRWAFYQWECEFHGVRVCRLCWASLYSTSNGCVPWLAAWSDLPHHRPSHKTNEIHVHASCTNSLLLVFVLMLNCVLFKKKTKKKHDPVCLHDVLWTRTTATHDDAPRFRSWCFTFYR